MKKRTRRNNNTRRAGSSSLKSVVSFVILALMGVGAAYLEYLNQEEHQGMARVLDGDSLKVNGQEVRLRGIDAPELHQNCSRNGKNWPCGRKAKDRLKSLIGNRTVRCDGGERDKFDRLLAVCKVAGQDLNKMMVMNGFAVSFGSYEKEESTAEAKKVGIWRGEFQQPRDWRNLNGRNAKTR